ncbi:MAG: ATP-dependent DNA helicase RecQ [Pseudomonadota bacterium]
MHLDPNLREALRRHFGFSSFRPGQEAIVRSVLEGRNTVAVMPTGAGKSLCYQLPAMLLPGTCLVVSPLVALMKDQVDSLSARGIPATFINSSIDEAERSERIQKMRAGAYKLVYVAPERFRSPQFLRAVQQMEISLYAVDEAHCISQWGHDFRPDYLQLGKVRRALLPPRTLALTATATPEVRADIVRVLRMKDPRVFVAGFDRPNLFFQALEVEDEREKFRQVLRACRLGGGVVYCATRRDVERVASRLAEAGVFALAYHAGMSEESRRRIQDAFMAEEGAVVCATNAFGMGVDKPSIRFVAHWSLPRSIEAYYQEAGRAGRDGKPALALLLYRESDVRLQQRMIYASHPSRELLHKLWKRLLQDGTTALSVSVRDLAAGVGSPYEVEAALKHLEKARRIARGPGDRITLLRTDPLGEEVEEIAARRRLELSRLDEMVRYARRGGCRRAHLLSYFGEESDEQCAGCDVCVGRPWAALSA